MANDNNMRADNKIGPQATQEPCTQKLVSASEQISMVALINYLAHEKNLGEENILRNFLDRFNIASLEALPAAQYDQAVKYLVDQLPNSAVA